jgi:hypothetical protein
MAYISAQDVKAIRDELKATFPKFKFGVRKGYEGSSVDVTIKQGPVDFAEVLGADAYTASRMYAQINEYHLYNYGKYEAFFEQVLNIIKTAPARAGCRACFDKSDSQIDSFHIAYYIHLNIGAWDSPYECTREYA